MIDLTRVTFLLTQTFLTLKTICTGYLLFVRSKKLALSYVARFLPDLQFFQGRRTLQRDS